MKRNRGRIGILLSLIVCLVGACVLFSELPATQTSDMGETDGSSIPNAVTAIGLYVFAYKDANGDYVGAPSFGSSNQAGITKTIELALPTHTNDFITIGADNAARETFLTG